VTAVAGGRGAVTTRAVASHVGVTPPTIYRLFGESKRHSPERPTFGWLWQPAASDRLGVTPSRLRPG
jgi:hypothetical protein